MGYTHYWYRPAILDRDNFILFKDDVRKIIASVQDTPVGPDMYCWYNGELIVIRDGDGYGSPTITNTTVLFNGDSRLGFDHESFYVPRVLFETERYSPKNDGVCFCFCKTARKPYDIAVVASLMALKYRFGDDIRLASDGDLDELKFGVGLAEEVLRTRIDINDYLTWDD